MITFYRPRLLPVAIGSAGALALCKAVLLWHGLPGLPASGGVQMALIAPAAASSPAPAPSPAPSPAPAVAPARPAPAPPVAPAPPAPDPVSAAERSVLESLRGRREALEQREQSIGAREAMLGAAEARLNARIEELGAQQRRLEALEQKGSEREEANWRSLVKTYETMRPRDAAAVFDDLEMPVLVEIVDRMREAKAAPVLGAMRPDRARQLTAELARHRGNASNPANTNPG